MDLGDYSTSLDFVQNSVPATLDRSVLFLTGLIGEEQPQFSSSNSY